MRKTLTAIRIAKYFLFFIVFLCMVLCRYNFNICLLDISILVVLSCFLLDIVLRSTIVQKKIFSLIRRENVNAIGTDHEIERMKEELRQKSEELEVIRNVAEIITSTFEITVLVEYLYKVFSRFTGCDRYFICLYDKEIEKLVCRYEYGDITFNEVGHIYDEVTSVMKCFREGQVIKKINTYISNRGCFGDKMSIPMNVSGELIGVIFIETGKPETFQKVNLQFMESLASYAAIAISNAELFMDTYMQKQEIESLYEEAAAVNEELNSYIEELNKAKNELNEKNLQLTKYYRDIQTAYMQTVTALANSIQAKDAYTMGHCQRVKEICCEIAKRLNFSEAEVQMLEYAAILHDIGKIGIRASILNKRGRLTTAEYNEIKKHPIISYNILKDVKFLKDGLNGIIQHHEKYDGTGYPYGLKGNEICLYGRILCIADAFDAMTSSRPYRKAMSAKEALNEIKRCKGTQFDPEIADLFIEIMRDKIKFWKTAASR
ncbi:MAG TPA: HD domain-containing protein [Clostridiaceae bacterium]|nr:HD domain-containing protein [Clostridiaceae bacterium]